LHVSCAKFIRDQDVAVLGWDMLDARPDKDGLPWPVHGVLYSYGVALLDNALLDPLAQACADERRYEFMFMALPLKIARGTGSPVNPIALF
jgi:kynurenine formamidase